jgi:hypothetical protein
MRATGWKSGDRLWVVEAIAPFGTEEMAMDLRAKVFEMREMKYDSLSGTSLSGTMSKARSLRPMQIVSCRKGFAGLILSTWIMLIYSSLGASAQHAAAGQDIPPQAGWEKDAPTINRLLSSRQCDTAWQLLLKHIRTGHRQALLTAASAMGVIHGPRLRLPGAPADGLSTIRIVTIFASLGVGPGDFPNAAAFHKNFAVLLRNFHPACGADLNISECYKYVRNNGIVPSLDDFLREIDDYQARAKTGATCIEPLFKLPQD